MAYKTTIGNYVKFLRGTPTAWAKINDAEKDSDTLYFISENDGETGQLYLGSKLIIGEVSEINNLGDLKDIILSNDISDGSILVYQESETAGEAGTWVNKPFYEVLESIYGIMKGATAEAAGDAGLVPTPMAGDNTKYLKGDGSWANPTAAVELTLTNLIGDDTGKSIRDISTDVLSAVIDGADEKFDTLKEISDWILANKDAEDIIDLEGRVSNLEDLMNGTDKITGVLSHLTTLDTEFSDLSTTVSNLDTKLQGEIDTINVTLNGTTEDPSSGLVSVVSTMQTTMNTMQNDIDVLEEKLKWQDIVEE